jgi:hypothetical protein
MTSTAETIGIDVFPFGIMLMIMIANITESNFLVKCWGTVITAAVAAILFGNPEPKRARGGRKPFAARGAPF